MTTGTTSTRRFPAKRPTFSTLLAAVALVAAACGGAGGAPATNGAGGGGSPAAAGFCKTAAAFAETYLATGVSTDAAMDRYLEDLDALVAQAPDEIKDDLVVVRDFNRKVAATLDGDQSVEITDADQAAFEAASSRLDSYLSDTCGVDLSETSEEYAGEPGALGAQTGTLELSGLADVNAEYAALEVNCDYTGEQLYVDMTPADDGWSTSFVVDGLGELQPVPTRTWRSRSRRPPTPPSPTRACSSTPPRAR